jgi:hypothetical protein
MDGADRAGAHFSFFWCRAKRISDKFKLDKQTEWQSFLFTFSDAFSQRLCSAPRISRFAPHLVATI